MENAIRHLNSVFHELRLLRRISGSTELRRRKNISSLGYLRQALLVMPCHITVRRLVELHPRVEDKEGTSPEDQGHALSKIIKLLQ